MGHIKPSFLPTQKEERKPFHFVAWHSDPVLKRVARETLKMSVIKFSGLSQESVSSSSLIHSWERTEERPHADKRTKRDKGMGRKTFAFIFSVYEQVHTQLHTKVAANMREDTVDYLCVCLGTIWDELNANIKAGPDPRGGSILPLSPFSLPLSFSPCLLTAGIQLQLQRFH